MDLRDRRGFESSTPGGKALEVAHKLGVPVEWSHADSRYWGERNSEYNGTDFVPGNYYRMLIDENTKTD